VQESGFEEHGTVSGPAREIRESLNSDSGFFYRAGRTIVTTRTRYQKAELIDTPFLGRVLLLDNATQVAERWEYRYHEPMVHPAMLAHPDPRRVLVIGGGDGGILREILRHRSVEAIDVAELDDAVVSFCREHLPGLNAGSYDDKRVHFMFGDGRAYVAATASGYDVIIMDMTDPEGPARFLYTVEFFRMIRARLRDSHGIFIMHGESPAARPAAFACIGKTLRAVFDWVDTASTFIPMYGTLWSFRYAGAQGSGPAHDGAQGSRPAHDGAQGSRPAHDGAQGSRPAHDGAQGSGPAHVPQSEIESRITERMTGRPQLTTGEMWPALFAPDPIIAEAEIHPDGRVISDATPDFPDCFSR
jgi:spermidine synthase